MLFRFRDEKSIRIFTALLFTDIRPDGEYDAELAEIRREAMRALKGFGKNAIGPVREVLEVRNPDATRAAVWVLRRIDAPEANDALQSLLRREERIHGKYVDESVLEDIRSGPVRRLDPETIMKRLQELKAGGHQSVTITGDGELRIKEE